MDNRKNIYLDSNYELYKTIYFYYIIVYYSLIVLYLIFSKFISEKQYTNKVTLLLLFIYLIIPIILSYLMNVAYEGYIYYLESLNLKEDIPTYNSLIEKM
jgi:multisubunit Na+/H+ antiporter MnhG subunit